RLDDVVISAGLQALYTVRPAILGGHEDDGHVPAAAQGGENIQAVLVRHQYIQQYDIRRVDIGERERVCSVGRGQYIEALLLKFNRKHAEDTWLVIDGEDCRTGVHRDAS